MKKKNKWLAVMLVTLLSYGMAWMLGSMWPVLQVWYAQVLIWRKVSPRLAAADR